MAAPEKQALFIITDYFPSTGGPATTARAFAREMRGRGWTIHVATRHLSRKWPRREDVDGVHVHRNGSPGYGKRAKLADLLATWSWLLRTERRFTFVITFMDPNYAVIAWAAGLGGRTVLRWATLGDADLYMGRGPLSALRLHVLRRCMHTALTPAMANELRERGIAVEAIIPVPTDTSRFRPASPLERADARARLRISADVTIVFTGHLEPRKGVDLLIRAFASIVEGGQSVHLLVVGGNHGHAENLRPALDDYVRAKSLQSCVTLTGVVDDVAPYLRAGDIFCLPSAREGMSNSLVEAMACGLACVAPASAGGEDLLTHGAGVIPPSNSMEDLSAALTPLIDDADLRARLGKVAVARVQDQQLAAVVDAYEQLYALIQLKASRRSSSTPHNFNT